MLRSLYSPLMNTVCTYWQAIEGSFKRNVRCKSPPNRFILLLQFNINHYYDLHASLDFAILSAACLWYIFYKFSR